MEERGSPNPACCSSSAMLSQVDARPWAAAQLLGFSRAAHAAPCLDQKRSTASCNCPWLGLQGLANLRLVADSRVMSPKQARPLWLKPRGRHQSPLSQPLRYKGGGRGAGTLCESGRPLESFKHCCAEVGRRIARYRDTRRVTSALFWGPQAHL